MGNRIAKIEKTKASGGGLNAGTEWNETYYTRDASGNIMATYDEVNLLGTTAGYNIEYPLYGSSRLGIKKFKTLSLFERNSRTVGNKFYELSNHLGNVNVVVSDRRLGVDEGEVLGIADFANGNTSGALPLQAGGVISSNNVDLVVSTTAIDQGSYFTAPMPSGIPMRGLFDIDLGNLSELTIEISEDVAGTNVIISKVLTSSGSTTLDFTTNGTPTYIRFVNTGYTTGTEEFYISTSAGILLVPDGKADYYLADVVSATDYYPFGMTMPGRQYTSENYRFGYQGSEKDFDVNSGAYTTHFRMLDTRLGRWFSTDPVVQPWQSTYSSMDNSPIKLNDPLGDCPGCDLIFKLAVWKTKLKSLVDDGVQNIVESKTKSASYNNDKVPQQVQKILNTQQRAKGYAQLGEASIELTEAALDITGSTVPGADNVTDPILAGINYAQKDYVTASMYTAGIFVPFVTGTTVKYALKGFVKTELKYGGKTFNNAVEYSDEVRKLGGNPREKRALVETVIRDIADSNGWKKSSELSGKLGDEVYDMGNGQFGSIDKLHGDIEIFNKKGSKYEHQGSIGVDGVQNKGRNKKYDKKL